MYVSVINYSTNRRRRQSRELNKGNSSRWYPPGIVSHCRHRQRTASSLPQRQCPYGVPRVSLLIQSSPSAVTAAVVAVKGDLDKEDYITSFYARAVRRDQARGGYRNSAGDAGRALVRAKERLVDDLRSDVPISERARGWAPLEAHDFCTNDNHRRAVITVSRERGFFCAVAFALLMSRF
ncbi:hypothetical protein EVAR_98018_1 [Eumeta japonica]|uniref:Uncharacterized protein n=1 Tax=Eumeta variegata TaxID=151549 RepID=A0A4C2A3K7_EUMVA|nr:hypothetical protein EVAR_98018_1 [Eumeta japonica]